MAAVLLAGLLLLAGCAHAPPCVIDAHVQVSFTGGKDPRTGFPDTLDELNRQQRAAGVVASVGHAGDDYAGPDLSARGIVRCASVPSVPEEPDLKRLQLELHEGRLRCLKVPWGYVGRWAPTPAYEAVYRLAAAAKVPVVLHMGEGDKSDTRVKSAEAYSLDELAAAHRDVVFVLSHLGNPWFASAADTVNKNPNVYADVSGFMTGDLSKSSPQRLEEHLIQPIRWAFGSVEDPTKLMFGSDWPRADVRAYLEACRQAVPQEYWRAFFHDNAARVFGIKGP